ncbi:RING finger protein 150, partial [Dissostichus eleginoides]
ERLDTSQISVCFVGPRSLSPSNLEVTHVTELQCERNELGRHGEQHSDRQYSQSTVSLGLGCHSPSLLCLPGADQLAPRLWDSDTPQIISAL